MALRKGNVVACLGLMGSGKTMEMVRLAYSQSRPIVSNFPVVGARRLEYFNELLDLYGVCILYDELQLTVDARNFAKEFNTDFSHFVELKVRKRDSILIYTVQDWEMVDINIRRVTSHIYFHTHVVRGGIDYCFVNVFQRDMMSTYKHVKKFRFPMSNYYAYYDTKFEDVVLPVSKSGNTAARSAPPARRAPPEASPSGVMVRRS